jgi:hypothetical protein
VRAASVPVNNKPLFHYVAATNLKTLLHLRTVHFNLAPYLRYQTMSDELRTIKSVRRVSFF